MVTISNVLQQVTHAVLPQLSLCQELLQNTFYIYIPNKEEHLLSNICIKLPGMCTHFYVPAYSSEIKP
jgi:hypothetical protein